MCIQQKNSRLQYNIIWNSVAQHSMAYLTYSVTLSYIMLHFDVSVKDFCITSLQISHVLPPSFQQITSQAETSNQSQRFTRNPSRTVAFQVTAMYLLPTAVRREYKHWSKHIFFKDLSSLHLFAAVPHPDQERVSIYLAILN